MAAQSTTDAALGVSHRAARSVVPSGVPWRQRALTLPRQERRVTVVPRMAWDSRLYPHFHGVFLNDVYVEQGSGRLEFHVLPRLDVTEVADVLAQ